MLTRREYKGPWWLPGNESNQLPGTLVVEKGKTTLEVIGDFGRELISKTARERVYSLQLEERSRLLGTSTDGKPITLEGIWEGSSKIHFPGLPTANYRAGTTLVGRHFAEGETIAFDEIAISASDLNAWTQVSGFRTSIETEELDDEGHAAFVGTEVRYEAPDEIRIPLARGEEIALRFTCHGRGLWGRSDRVEIRQEAALHWRFPRPIDLFSVFDRVGQVRNFLSLAVGRPVSITSVAGFKDGHKLGSSNSLSPIDLYWEISHNPDPPESARDPREMLFTLNQVEPDASTVIKRWLARQDRLEPVFNLYFGTLYHPSLYLEVRFLAFAQALETYDFRRRRKPGSRSLAERTYDVLRQCRTVTSRIVGADSDRFVTDFKNTRNYYTHYNPKLEGKAATGAALYLLTLELQTILEMSFLRQLGFPCRTIEEVLARAGRFAQIEHFRSRVAQQEAKEAQEME